MIDMAPGWGVDVERGPDWLFVRVHCDRDHCWDAPPLAETVWSLLEQHFTRRVVVELDDVELLHSGLIGELARLHKRVVATHGVMKICGLSQPNRETLHTTRLDEQFGSYADRTEAVLGHRPRQPR